MASNSKTTYLKPNTSFQKNDFDMLLTFTAISSVTAMSGIHQTRIYRAQSLPDMYNPPAVTVRRKNSLEIKTRYLPANEIRTLQLPFKLQALKKSPVKGIVKKQPTLVKQNITFEHVRNVTKDLCIRTSSLSTVMAFLCFGLTVANMVNIFSTAYIVVAERRFCLVLHNCNTFQS